MGAVAGTAVAGAVYLGLRPRAAAGGMDGSPVKAFRSARQAPLKEGVP
jgi:hypothetical protein